MKRKPEKRVVKNSASKDAVRWRIIEDASHHFFTHGFRSVTMDDLAQELGMSKKTLYFHFDTKLQLLDAVIENKFRRVRGDFDSILAARRDFPEMLREFLDCVQRHTSAIQPPFLRDMRLEGPEVFQKIERLRSAIMEQCFGQLMRIGREAGFIRNDIPAYIIVEILLAAVHAIVRPSRLEELGLTPRSACGLITKVVLEGAIAPAGRSQLKPSSSP
jgi:AcrR family transcriptional regulator